MLLTKLKNSAQRLRYAIQAIDGGWSRSTVEANIRDKLLERHGKAVNNFRRSSSLSGPRWTGDEADDLVSLRAGFVDQ